LIHVGSSPVAGASLELRVTKVTPICTIDETLETVRRARGLEALRAIRRASQKSGRGRLTGREIDAVIRKTRRGSVLVTGNTRPFPVSSCRGVEVLTPRQLRDRMR